jgi:hypothetical protein
MTTIEELKKEFGPCPFCGNRPTVDTIGTFIEIYCCCNMSIQKSDYLNRDQKDTWHQSVYMYSEEAEKIALRAAIGEWNTRPLPAATPQPPPAASDEDILALVLSDLQARSDFGLEKYGTRLKANNGRDALMDAYQEALDLVMYLRQLITERG